MSDYIFLAALAAVTAVYLWKIPLGIADMDETFYMTIPYRMLKGDCLLVDEWHVSQLSGFILYPIMKLYLMIFNSTEGIALAFRYIFLFFHMLVMCIAYIATRKRYGAAAVAMSALYGLFVPFNITALSYNSMGISFCFLLAVLNLEKPKNKWMHLFNGALISGLVLCNPYAVILYLIYVLYLISIKDTTGLIYTHISIVVLALICSIHLIRHASLDELLVNFQYIMHDSEHPKKLLETFWSPIKEFYTEYYIFIFLYVLFGIFAAKHKEGRNTWLIGIGALSVFMSNYFAVSSTHYIGMNAIMLMLTPFGFILFFYVRERNWRFFMSGLFFPVIYALCLNISSNQRLFAISDACSVSSCITFLLLGTWLKENFNRKQVAAAILSVLVLFQATSELYIRSHHFFAEDFSSTAKDLTAEISFGPLKGIKTTEINKTDNERLINELKGLGLTKDMNLLFYELVPCGYFAVDAAFGTYSAWTVSDDMTALENYYDVHPEKVPDVIYLLAKSYAANPELWENACRTYPYEMQQTPIGNYVLVRQ